MHEHPRPAWLPLTVALLAAWTTGAAYQDAAVGVRLIQTDSPSTAETLRARVAAGDSFSELARTHSLDPTAASGGYLGTVRIGDLRPEFREALSGVERGETSPAIQVDGRWVILRLATEAEDAWLSVTDAGRQALIGGRGADAEALFRQAVAQAEALGGAGRPLLVESLRNLSALVQIEGDAVQAERLYVRSMEVAWGRPAADRDAGVAEALDAFTDVILLSPFPDADLDAARERHTAALRRAPLAERSFWAMAGILDSAGMADEAERTLTVAVEAFPDSTASLRELADHRLDSGGVREAIDDFQRALGMPGDARVDPSLGVIPASYFHQRIGDAYGSLVQYEDAVAAYGRALEIDPGNPGARFELGGLHYVNNRFDDALAEYDTMLESNPGNVDLLHRIAEAELGAGRFEDAVSTSRRVLEIRPDLRRARYVLGTALVRMGRVEEGRAELMRYGEQEAEAGAADRLGQELATLDNQARTAFAGGRREEGFQLYREAIDAHPDVALFRLNLAVAESRLARHDDAAARLETVIELGLSDNALVHRALADAYATLGDAEASRRHRIAGLQRLDAWLRSELE